MERLSEEAYRSGVKLQASVLVENPPSKSIALKQPRPGIRILNLAYLAAPVIAIGSWLFAIRVPLWLDETVSYWQSSGGFGQLWARQGLSFPAYTCILWISRHVLGSSEIALRIPSIIAMVAAVYVLYRIAREFFDDDVSVIVTSVFCVYPTVAFAAIDARPYAFGMLTVNCAVLSFLRWMRTRETRWAIAAGVTAGFIFYFQYLFGTLLVAFALLMFVRGERWKGFWLQLSKALVAFAMVMLPIVSRLVYLFRTRQSHVFASAPDLAFLQYLFTPGYALPLFGLAALIAAVIGGFRAPARITRQQGAACLLLASVPVAILYGVSILTPLHIFVGRYLLAAVPGIALCWGLLLSQINSRALRLLFCLALIALAGRDQFNYPSHGYTWKYAIDVANQNTAEDHAPVLMCSDLPEADHEPMPKDVTQSWLFAPVSYYKLSSPVVPLPRTLNEEARSQVSKFLAGEAPARRRFLLLAYWPSHAIVGHLWRVTRDSYTPRTLGVYDGVSVIEYVPR